MGSAQLITDPDGEEYERIEYTPYDELWIEKTRQGIEKLPFRFTGKEFDSETGLYYYGARYISTYGLDMGQRRLLEIGGVNDNLFMVTSKANRVLNSNDQYEYPDLNLLVPGDIFYYPGYHVAIVQEIPADIPGTVESELSKIKILEADLTRINGVRRGCVTTARNLGTHNAVENLKTRSRRLSLSPGSSFVCLSDGLIEQKDREGQSFDLHCVAKHLGDALDRGEGLLRAKIRILEDFWSFKRELPQHDDISMLFFSFKSHAR